MICINCKNTIMQQDLAAFDREARDHGYILSKDELLECDLCEYCRMFMNSCAARVERLDEGY